MEHQNPNMNIKYEKVMPNMFDLFSYSGWFSKKEGRTLQKDPWVPFRIIFTWLLMLPYAVFVPGHFYITYKEDLTAERIDAILLFLIAFFMVIASTIYLFTRFRTMHVLICLGQFKFGKPLTHDNINKMADFWGRMFVVFVFVSVSFGAIIHYKQNMYCTFKNVKYGYVICGMLVPTWVPIYLDFSPARECLALYQVCSISVIGSIIGSTAVVLVAASALMKARLDDLLERLRTSTSKLSKQSMKTYFQYFLEIKQLVSDMNYAMEYAHFPQASLAPIILGLLLYQLVRNNYMLAALHLATWYALEFLVCQSGQILIDGCLILCYEIYNLPWYEMDIERQKLIFMFLIQCQKPFILVAKPLSVLSYEMYHTIIASSYTYLTFLKNF